MLRPEPEPLRAPAPWGERQTRPGKVREQEQEQMPVPGREWPPSCFRQGHFPLREALLLRQVFRRILDCVSPLKVFRLMDTGRWCKNYLARIVVELFPGSTAVPHQGRPDEN